MKSIYVLPGQIVKAIDQAWRAKSLTPFERNQSIKAVAAMWLKYHSEKIPFSEYSPFARNYYRSVLKVENKEVQSLLNKLSKANIIESWNEGDYLAPSGGKKGVCRKWRINPSLVYSSNRIEEIELIQKLKKNRKRKSLIEVEAREHLRKIKLPFEDRDKIISFVTAFIKSDQVQQTISDRIEETKDIPSRAILLLDDSKNHTILEKSYIPPYLRAGLKLFRYKGKGRVAFYLTTYDKLKAIKEKELSLSYQYQLYILNNVDQANASSCNRNETNSRLDTPITNLFSKFLALATVDGEKLISIDLSNSQFVFLASRLQKWIDENREHFLTKHLHRSGKNSLSNNKEIDKNNYKKTPERANNKNTISYLGNVTPQLSDNQETNSFFRNLELFVKVCFSGQLYEYIAARYFLQKEYANCSDQEKRVIKIVHRSKIKQALFELLFDKWNAWTFKADRKANRDVLLQVFPALVHWIETWKKEKIEVCKREREANPGRWKKEHFKDGRVQSPYEAGNNAFSIMLQRDESFLFIDKILQKLQKKGLWCASKHDSILTTQSDYKRVLKLMCDQLDNAFESGNYHLKKETYHWDGETGLTTHTEQIVISQNDTSISKNKENPVTARKPASTDKIEVYQAISINSAIAFLSQSQLNNLTTGLNFPGRYREAAARAWTNNKGQFNASDESHQEGIVNVFTEIIENERSKRREAFLHKKAPKRAGAKHKN